MNGFPGKKRGPRGRLALALAAALGGAFAAPSDIAASVQAVSNCDDSGSGSLRDAVAAAASGDTIDLGGLSCSRITLTSGAIVVAQDSLALVGPGADALAIDGNSGDRVFYHTGANTLGLTGLTIANGRFEGDTHVYGGCIASKGHVVLSLSVVSGCVLVGSETSLMARGGAVYTQGNLVLVSSVMSGNTVDGSGSQISNSKGGAGVVRGNLTMKYSSVDGNAASTIAGHNSGCGAFQVYGSGYILASTISNNHALFTGAIGNLDGGVGDTLVIRDSTISGNRAIYTGAIYTQLPTEITNSTIAFNTSSIHGALYSQLDPIHLQSTIIAANAHAGASQADDLDGTDATLVTGANNLIGSSTVPVPADTISACPKLRALDDNGGPTRTHALADTSIAIDAGNNDEGHDTDQRGEPRVIGAAADIGAYEWNAPVGFGFHSGFEAICDS